MGDRHTPIHVMAWRRTLGEMKAHGTSVMLTGCRCGHSEDQDVDRLIVEMGEAGSLWDLRPVCPRCLTEQHFMASAGPGTPYRPMLSGVRPVSGAPNSKGPPAG